MGAPMASDAGMEVLTGPRNLDHVRRAVAESGYQGERAVVPIPTDLLTLKAMGEVGVDMLKRLGINVEPRYTDWGSAIQLLAKMEPVEQGGWSALHTSWSGFDQFDPAVHLWIRGNGRQATRGWPESPQLEALRDAWFRADDITDQRRIAADIQRQVFVDVPYIPLGQYLPLTVFQRTIVDVLSGYPLFWNLRKAE